MDNGPAILHTGQDTNGKNILKKLHDIAQPTQYSLGQRQERAPNEVFKVSGLIV